MNKDIIHAKLKKIRRIIKRVCPNLRAELIVVVAIISALVFASGVTTTATFDQEMFSTSVEVDVETEPTIPPQESEFEIIGGEQEVTTQVIEYPASQICIIGDSRTYAMSGAVVTDAHFIAKSAMGLDWFNKTASVEFERIKDDVSICVVALGVNDIFNADKYVARLNEFAEQYPDKILVYLNIGPVDETKYTGIPNSRLEQFNKTLQDGLSNKWQILDLYSYLTTEGFESSDGLHYSFVDSAKIFTWVINSVKNQTITIVGSGSGRGE